MLAGDELNAPSALLFLFVVPPPGALRALPVNICLNSNGGADMLATKYQGMVAPQPRAGHSLTLTTDLDNPTVAPEQLLKRLQKKN